MNDVCGAKETRKEDRENSLKSLYIGPTGDGRTTDEAPNDI